MQGGESADADASSLAEAAAGFTPVPRFAGPGSAFCFCFVLLRVVRGLKSDVGLGAMSPSLGSWLTVLRFSR